MLRMHTASQVFIVRGGCGWHSTSGACCQRNFHTLHVCVHGRRREPILRSFLHVPYVLRQLWNAITALRVSEWAGSLELKEPAGHTLSKKGWIQVTEWISECNKSHARCAAAKNSPRWYPTRLIDLGSRVSPNLHLIETSRTTPLGAYGTLSYCWGTAATVKLTCNTLGEFLARLPVSTLPKTFQDAISVARRLGLRYLWIDSLCIIQDSPGDWLAESSAMGQVYQNGLFNIAATASSDSTGGLFFDRDPRSVRPAIVATNWSDCPSSTYVVANRDTWVDGVSNAVLNTRGWVLQERCLSPRIIHFGSDQLYWECLELQACEAFPTGLPATMRRNRLELPKEGKNINILDEEFPPKWQQSPLPKFDGYRAWKRLIETYSRTQLSHATDKLNAISALAKGARLTLQDEYLAGLWRQSLGWELAWTATKQTSHTRSSAYRPPTWSWASIDGEIRYTDYGDDESLLVNILEAEITPAGLDTTGAVSGGFVRPRGFLYPILLARTGFCGEFSSFLIGGLERWVDVNFYLDIDIPAFLASGVLEDCYILPHHSETYQGPDSYQMTALLLRYD
ncbi:HET-domain-containing protein, partial [Parathielavia appendiculata]